MADHQTRRTLVRGLAWTAPVAAIGVAAPVLAASVAPDLEGRMEVQRNDSGTGQCNMTLGGSGPSDYTGSYGTSTGTWVQNARSTTTVTNLTITVYLPAVWSGATVTNLGSPGWTPLVQVANPVYPPGVPTTYVAYTTSYGGAWNYDSVNRALETATRTNFRLSRSGDCLNALTIYVERTATVDGVFQRDVNQRQFNL